MTTGGNNTRLKSRLRSAASAVCARTQRRRRGAVQRARGKKRLDDDPPTCNVAATGHLSRYVTTVNQNNPTLTQGQRPIFIQHVFKSKSRFDLDVIYLSKEQQYQNIHLDIHMFTAKPTDSTEINKHLTHYCRLKLLIYNHNTIKQ